MNQINENNLSARTGHTASTVAPIVAPPRQAVMTGDDHAEPRTFQLSSPRNIS
jgi:hypothetical protein